MKNVLPQIKETLSGGWDWFCGKAARFVQDTTLLT
jgi:hypothetical protein